MATMSPHGSAVTLTAGEGRTEATSITRESEGLRMHRSGGTSLAAAPLPRLLDHALRPAHGGAAARPRGDQSPGRPNGRREPLVGRS